VSRSPASIAIAAFLVLLVVACDADVAPTTTTDAAPANVLECANLADDLLEPVIVHDHAGLVTACRHVSFDETTAIREALGPPMSRSMDDTSLELSRADDEGSRLLILWIVRGCSEAARIDILEQAGRYRLEVAQTESGICAGGTGLTAVEVAFARPIARRIEGNLRRQ
jgi:hypothetical protein